MSFPWWIWFQAYNVVKLTQYEKKSSVCLSASLQFQYDPAGFLIVRFNFYDVALAAIKMLMQIVFRRQLFTGALQQC